MKLDMSERFPIVTPEGEIIGAATRAECHGGSKLLHPVVHLHLIDGDGRVYLQKRVMTKDIQPGKWDTAVGGHVDLGESVGEALRREASEELGHEIADPRHILTYVFESDRERELVNVFAERVDSAIELHPDPTEVDEGRFWTPEEIAGATGRSILTPNFESEYARIRPLLEKL